MKTWNTLLVIIGALVQIGFGQSRLQPSDVVGVWEGTLHSFGQESRLIYKISINDDGSLSASHDSPDFSLNDIPVTEAKLEGNRLTMKMAFSGFLFEGMVGKDIVRGHYGTPELWIPLTLRRRSRDPRFLLENMVPRLGNEGKRILGYRYTTPEEGDDGWEVTDAMTERVDTSKIGVVMRRILAGGFPNLHSMVVVKDGKLILDEYFHGFHRDRPHRISSIAKIVPEASIGLAIERGLIKNMQSPLCELFPEYSDLLCTEGKRAITLYHLLTMTTGLRWDENAVSYFDSLNDLSVMKRSPDPVRNLFERPLAYRPGERFVYNSGCVIAMEALIQKVTKAHFLLLAQKELFTPLGISNYRWDYSEGLYMLPRDMAKIGWLFLKSGEFNGTRVLPAAWADSAIQRFERQYPRYFNHWEPLVFFVDGAPIRALRAGGWGGQSITIFPGMNTVIVATAANQLQPADYDVCMRDYLLPAILTPQYLAKHPEVRYSGIHRARSLEWETHDNTEMACLKACAKSFGIPLADAQLYGATGVGFLINIDERAEPKSVAVWNWRGAYELCRNLGFSVESIWMHKSDKEFPATQKLVWDRVRRAIDSGYACYGFDLHNGTRSLIIGYDEIGYYDMGMDAEKGKGPAYWYELGQTSIGLLGMHFVRPVSSKVTFREMVKKSFQFVLEFSANSPKWVPADCKAGPDGYARWISLLESGREDGNGVSINAAVYAEGRRFAVEFLEEAKLRLGPELRPLFDEAIRHYRVAAQSLATVSQAFPNDTPAAQRAANLKDPQRRKAAIQHLRAAKDAEVEGVKALASILERLEKP
jgi:CubicO group peptidase (beta-lactamase class C family)